MSLDNYIMQLLTTPDPEFDARRKAFDSATKEFERKISALNSRVKADGTLAEKLDLRRQESALREELRQHKLNYHEYMQATPAVSPLPSLSA